MPTVDIIVGSSTTPDSSLEQNSSNGHTKFREKKKKKKMPIGRRGLIVPQNTFLEDVIRRSDGLHESFMVGSADIPDSPVIYCSDGFSQLTGFKRSEVMKFNCDGKFLLGPHVKKDVSEKIQNALRLKLDCQVEFIGRKKEGTPLWYLFHMAPIKNEDDVVVLFLVTVRDISAYKEPITENGATQNWVKLKRTLTKDRNAFVVAFSKTKEEKNKIRIAQMMVQNTDVIPQYKQQIPKSPKWVILHYSTTKIIWDWILLLFILYTASAVPFVFCFEYKSDPMLVVDCLVDAFFIADIVINFHTSYIGQDGEVITDLKQIRRYYLRTWFFFDLVTSLPYGLLSLAESSNGVFVNLISVFKCIRLLRVSRVIRKLDNFINYGFITLILLLVIFLLCAHLLACIFYLIANKYDQFQDIGWVAIMAKQTNQRFNTTVEGGPHLPTLASLYVSALYYCLTSLTTIGFGNISPNTTAEKIFGCITMIAGVIDAQKTSQRALGYAVIFGQVTAIVQQAQSKSEKYHALLDNIKAFQKLYRVPGELSARILDYFMSTWALTKGVDTDEVLKQCPKDLQSDICIHLNRKVLHNNSAFANMPMSVLRTIARDFCICHVAPGDLLIREGDGLDALYFISHGSFEVKQDGHVVGLLGEGDVFGDDVCNEVNVGKSVADVFALTYSDIHCIDRNDLREVLMSYPECGVEFSRNLKLSFNLRNQVRKKASSTYSYDEQPSLQLPARTTRLLNPVRSNRRLSLVQELNQTIDLESVTAVDRNTNRSSNENSEITNFRGGSRRPERLSGNVISEAEEIDRLPSSEDVQTNTYTDTQDNETREEASLSFHDGKVTAVERELSQLKADFNEYTNDVKSKLSRVESQLSLILRLVQNANKLQLTARHTQSFPSPSTSRYNSAGSPNKSADTGSDHPASTTNTALTQDEGVTSSRNWLQQQSLSPNASGSAGSRRKSSVNSEHEKDEDDSSSSLMARHGRRKINTSDA